MSEKDLCRRCGECCRFKTPHDRFWVADDRYCPHFERLPGGEGSCRIYEDHVKTRVDENAVCASVEQLAMAGLLPESCPYAKRIPGYRSHVIGYREDF